MSELLKLKQAAFDYCNNYITDRINTIQEVLSSISESRNNESKSSVGDKYETGRAMLHLEEEKNQTQLLQLMESKNILATINIERKYDKTELGSLVVTNSGNYFIAIGIGKIKMGNEVIYSISLESPIGQVLKNKQEGAEILFNQKKIRIQQIL